MHTFLMQPKYLIECRVSVILSLEVFELLGLLLVKPTQYPHKMEDFNVQGFWSTWKKLWKEKGRGQA